MKLNSAVSKFLTNKWVLNIIAVLALFNVIGYAVLGNLNAVIIFIIIGVLVRYFSKNMTIVLGIPLIIVNLLVTQGTMKEGMENSSSKNTNKNSSNNSTNPVNIPVKQNKVESLTNNNNKQEPKTSQGLPMTKVANASTQNNAAQTTDGFEAGRRKNKGYEVDYATTIEEAYDNLNNILGSDGIQRLTSDSQKLMQQQLQLAESMKNMGPLIESIQPMVQNLQGMMSQMDGKEGLGGIMDLAKKLIPAQKA
jgi:hypothetical protein